VREDAPASAADHEAVAAGSAAAVAVEVVVAEAAAVVRTQSVRTQDGGLT